MFQSLFFQSLSHPELVHQIDRPLLEYTGPDPLLHVIAGAHLKHDRFDPVSLQQQRQKKSRGSRANNANLRSHFSVDHQTHNTLETILYTVSTFSILQPMSFRKSSGK